MKELTRIGHDIYKRISRRNTSAGGGAAMNKDDALHGEELVSIDVFLEQVLSFFSSMDDSLLQKTKHKAFKAVQGCSRARKGV